MWAQVRPKSSPVVLSQTNAPRVPAVTLIWPIEMPLIRTSNLSLGSVGNNVGSNSRVYELAETGGAKLTPRSFSMSEALQI